MPQVPQNDDNPYSETLSRVRQREDLKLRQSTAAAAESNPDQHAEILKLSERTRFSPAFVGRNFETLQRKTHINDFKAFRFNAPKTVSWLSLHPDNMSVGQDDTGPLSNFERLLTGARVLFSGAVMRNAAGVMGLLETFAKTPIPAEGLGSLESGVDYTPLLKTGVRSPVSDFLEDRRRMTEAAMKTIRGNFEKRSGPMEQAVFGGIESIGQVVSTLPLGPAGMLGVMGASTAGSSATKATDQGLPPSVALAFGSIDGAIEVATERIPVGLLFKQAQLAAPFVKTLVKQLAAEIPGEQIATVLQDLNAWAVLPENKDATFRDYLKARPSAGAQTLVATIVGTLGQGGIARAAARVSGKSIEQAVFEELGKNTSESKTFQRLPPKLQEFVREATKDGPLETVYAPIDTWQTYWQEQEADPRQVAQELLGSTAVYDQAVAAGTDLAVPLAVYTTQISSTPHNAFFSRELRLAPDQPNAREQDEFAKQVEELSQQEATSPNQEGTLDPARLQLEASADQVRQDVIGQLIGGRGFERSTVEAYADQVAAVFRSLGSRIGLAPFALYEPYKLKINRPVPELLRNVPKTDELDLLLNRLRKEGIPAAGRDIYGPSLVDFLRTKGGVIDQGGDLRSLEVDGERRRGERNLVQKNGLPLDRAREMAAEAGYLAEGSTVAEFLDAIERDVRGKPVYAPSRADVRKLDQVAMFEQLDGYLRSREVDIQKATNEDIRKLLSEAAVEQIDPRSGELFEQEGDDDARGRFQISPGRTFNIELLRKANLSTFLHETGHMYLEVFGDVVDELRKSLKETPGSLKETQQRVLADYDEALKFLGVTSRDQIGRAQHEQWARAYEAYLRDGKPPSPKLRSIFVSFGAWLRRVYRSLTDLRVELTPEVRGVFDRLLATDIEIAQAEQDAGVASMLSDAAMRGRLGMTEAQFEAYRPVLEGVRERAREKVATELLKDVWRENEEWWDREREKMRLQVAGEVHRLPVYQALAFLQLKALPDGSPLPEGMAAFKLDRKAIVDQHGESVLKDLPTKPYVYTVKDGVHPDVAAEQFGFSSGDEMIRALIDVKARPMKALIDAHTDDRMRETYGDKLLDGSLPQMARTALLEETGRVLEIELAAIHKKQREVEPFTKAARSEGLSALEAERRERAYERRFLEAEQKLAVAIAEGRKQSEIDALQADLDKIEEETRAGKQLLRSLPTLRQVRQWAEGQIAGMRIRELRPDVYRAAARRSGKASLEAATANDFQAAFDHKLQEMMNVELQRAAVAARELVDETREEFKDYFRSDEKIAKTRNMNYVQGARAIAARLLFPGRQAGVEEALRKIQAYDPATYEILQSSLPAGWEEIEDHRDVTVDTFRGLRDIAEGLWTLSRRDHTMLIDGKLMEREAIEIDLRGHLSELSKRFANTGATGLPTKFEQLERWFVHGKAWGRRVESWVTAMDGGPSGPFRTYVWNPVKDSVDQYRIRKVEVMTEYRALLEPIQKTLTRDKIAAPELNGYVFGKDGSSGMAELLGALLHSGNRSDRKSNLAKLLVGRGWATFLKDGTLDTSGWDQFIARMQRDGILTKAHYQFAQGVWDLFESLKPGLQRTHKDVYGFYFQEVPADEFLTPWGMFRGGYVPAFADPQVSNAAAIRNDKQMSFEAGTAWALPSAGKRSTIARVESFEKLAMNLNFIPQHIDWALRFIEIQPAAKDATRLLTGGVRGDLDAHDPEAASTMLMPWLMRAATQRISVSGQSTRADRIITALRARTGMQMLSLNVGNALQQLTGGFVAAVKIQDKRYLAKAAFHYFTAPRASSDLIVAKSDSMKTFLVSQAMEIQRQVDDILLNPGVFGKAANYTRRHAQVLAEFTQNMVNHVAWLAAHDEAAAQGADTKEAVRRADSVVRETQGSFFPEDVSRFEANNPWVRAASMFMGYFNMDANLLTTEVGNAIRSDRGGFARAGRILSVYTLGFMLPAVISSGILSALADDWGDDDDEGYMDDLLRHFIAPQVSTAAGMVPIVGPGVRAAYGAWATDESYDDDIRISPIVGLIGSGIKHLAGRSSRKREVRDALSILGIFTNTPLGALGRPFGYLIDVSEGKADPEGVVGLAQGLASGRTPRQ